MKLKQRRVRPLNLNHPYCKCSGLILADGRHIQTGDPCDYCGTRMPEDRYPSHYPIHHWLRHDYAARR